MCNTVYLFETAVIHILYVNHNGLILVYSERNINSGFVCGYMGYPQLNYRKGSREGSTNGQNVFVSKVTY